MDEERLIVPEHLWEDGEETVIRPRYFHEYTGQDRSKKTWKYLSKLLLDGEKHWTMFCCTALLDWVRPLWPQ